MNDSAIFNICSNKPCGSFNKTPPGSHRHYTIQYQLVFDSVNTDIELLQDEQVLMYAVLLLTSRL